MKDRDGDQRGGSEWEPIKILSKEELGLYPKITSKRPPQVLSRSRSNQSATNPRNNTAIRALKTRNGKQPEHSIYSGRSDRPTGAVRPPGVGSPVHNTPGHPSRNRDKSGHPSNTRRVTHLSTQMHNLVQGGLTTYQGRLDCLPLRNANTTNQSNPVSNHVKVLTLASLETEELPTSNKTLKRALCLGRLDRPLGRLDRPT